VEQGAVEKPSEKENAEERKRGGMGKGVLSTSEKRLVTGYSMQGTWVKGKETSEVILPGKNRRK